MEAIPSSLSQNQPTADTSFNRSVYKQAIRLTILVSWKPDPSAIATDPFILYWSTKLYANPPWSMIGRVLSQICQMSIQELVLVGELKSDTQLYYRC